MLTKKDLENLGEKLRKEFKEEIETAIVQIVESISKFVATKEDLKAVENRLGNVENRLGNVEAELKDVKRQINDLKADTPAPQDFANHEKRIKKLENAVFPS